LSDTPIADMVATLLASGAPPSLIVEAVRGAETAKALQESMASSLSADSPRTSADRIVETRRTKDRLRKAAARKALKIQQARLAAKANDVAASKPVASADMSADKREKPPLLTKTLNDSESLKEGRKKRSGVARAREDRGCRMVADAILTEPLRVEAVRVGAPLDRVDEMWAEFRDYWVGVPGWRGRKTDWPATWRNDVRKKIERGAMNGKHSKPSLSERAFQLAEQVRAREAASGARGSDDLFRRD
jgi:hypothetical protein